MEEFKILLTDKEFITEFQAFAADEFSVENVLAWSEIKLFEEYCLTNNARTIELGERICSQYVRPRRTIPNQFGATGEGEHPGHRGQRGLHT